MRLERIEKQGKTFVLVPEKIFEELLEDSETLEDIQIFEESIARNKNAEFFPSGLVNALIEGESPVLVYREYRGLTQAQLARKTGLTREYISMIESGKRKGSAANLKKIAAALKVDLDDLV